ncbi:MAG: hypothetical protein RIQ68_2130 [Pseudomonadota bacterium]|jgi:hypothetical protein
MAEYYPLLARAVAALPDSNPESRRSIYDRARAALVAQLRAVQPPIAEEDIAHESQMLDAAIAQLEAEAEAAAQAPAPTVEAPAAPASPSQAPDVQPETKAAEPPPVEPRKLAEPLVKRPEPGPTLAQRLASARPLSSSPGLPPRPTGEKGLSALEAARQRLANLARSSSSRPAGAPVVMPRPTQLPSIDAVKPTVAFKVPTPSERPAAPPEPVEELDRADQTQSTLVDEAVPAEPVVETDAASQDVGAPPPFLRKFGPRAEAAAAAAESEEQSDSSATASDEEADKDEAAKSGPSHPAAPVPVKEKERNLRPLLIGLPVALVVAAIAVFAWMKRDNPEEIAKLRPAPGAETSADATQGKIVERIGGGGAQVPRPVTAPLPPIQAQQQIAPQPGAQAVPVAQRAALLLDAPDEPERVKTFVGNVVWRLDNVSRGPGQPLAVGVRAEIDLPDAKLKAVMLIQKNTDETLPASHTIELRFIPADGGPVPGVAQIQTPQMRREDGAMGDSLVGVPAPILRNYFLIGLTRGAAAESRNVDMIRNRGWFDVPMLLSDQRIAKITFEKGSAGERIINEAFDAWK